MHVATLAYVYTTGTNGRMRISKGQYIHAWLANIQNDVWVSEWKSERGGG